MTLNSDMSGEQPLLSVKAHVYHIDPKSKKSWIPATAQAVPVSFFYDSARTLYRIISVEGTKAVINSIVTPAMTVTKTSQKFLQWSDSRANMVYGLGFSREEDLIVFMDKFKEVKELSQKQQGDEMDHHGNMGGIASGVSLAHHANGPAAFGQAPPIRSASPQSSASSNSSPRPPTVSSMGAVTPTVPHVGAAHGGPSTESQLRLENEKLREALARSSANADKWKVNLKSLEEEKLRFMKALEESHANLSRWETEVNMYRSKVVELENKKPGSGDDGIDSAAGSIRAEMDRLRSYVQTLEKRNQSKEAEVSNLTSRLEDLRLKESNMCHSSSERMQTMESDNRALKLAINDMQEKLSRQVALNENLKAELRLLKSHVNRQLTDWKKMEEKLAELISTNPVQ